MAKPRSPRSKLRLCLTQLESVLFPYNDVSQWESVVSWEWSRLRWTWTGSGTMEATIIRDRLGQELRCPK
jgi:hypothetical protein